jgi:hypothetical protein
MKKLYSALPFFLTLFLIGMVVFIILSTFQISANVEEPFVGSLIRPYMRNVRLTAENYLGDYGASKVRKIMETGHL